jgi:hypothetical protein
MSIHQITLTTEQLHLVCNGLRRSAHATNQSAVSLRRIAADLRDGLNHPLFADGEEGAVAADQSADEREARAYAFEDLLDAIEEIVGL